jgi:hypothetical protein
MGGSGDGRWLGLGRPWFFLGALLLICVAIEKEDREDSVILQLLIQVDLQSNLGPGYHREGQDRQSRAWYLFGGGSFILLIPTHLQLPVQSHSSRRVSPRPVLDFMLSCPGMPLAQGATSDPEFGTGM